ncbi:hypothetical protein ACVTMO_16805 [Pseudomonas segetis]
MNGTVKTIIKSEDFYFLAAMKALQIIAESNGRQMSDAIQAFKLGVPEVVSQVQAMVTGAAEDIAAELGEHLDIQAKI